MTRTLPRVSASLVIAKSELQQVFDSLRAAGFSLVGPKVRNEAIALEPIERLEELPVGVREECQPGRYRLAKTRENCYFRYTVSAHSWKQFLSPPRLRLFTAAKNNGRWKIHPNGETPPRYAFIGVRACDLKAIEVLDRVFLGPEFRDPDYAKRRDGLFILAVNCAEVACAGFCVSMQTGPRATSGFDLALTELPDVFLIEVGSEAGSAAMENTHWSPATAFDLGRATQALEHTERQLQRTLPTDGLPRMLYENLEHPHWEVVGARCLSCANCTLVCPTCFCSTVEDSSNLAGTQAERTRVWDSCFTLDFSHVHGGNVRPTVQSRYRQWLSHKLASWKDQFGVFGCVGCGRCITWCPVGIDLTQELKALRETAQT